MPQKSMNTDSRKTTRADAQANQEVDVSSVQDWKQGLKPSRTPGLAGTNRFAKKHAMLPWEQRTTQSYKRDDRGWQKPYGAALLETDSETLVKLLAATEKALFERLLELAADNDASDERQDIVRAIDVILTLKARKKD
jgi:hypothetical protein